MSSGKSDSASGQDREYTLTNPTTGDTKTLTQRQIREQRDQLVADGFTGHRLDDTTDADETPEEPSDV